MQILTILSGLLPSSPSLSSSPSVKIEEDGTIRRRDRFGDGLSEIFENTVEFYPGDYVPKRACRDELKEQVGSQLLNEAMSKTNGVNLDPLLPEEAATIYVYTTEGPFYPALNKAMRSGSQEERMTYRDYIYFLTKSLEKLEPVSVVVYRGIDCKLDDYKVGSAIVWPAFSSSSRDAKVGFEFLKKKSGTLFLINDRTPRAIDRFSAVASEQEVLFLPNSKFVISKVVEGASKELLSKSLNIPLEGVTIFELDELADQ